jgi:hypothetical protein
MLSLRAPITRLQGWRPFLCSTGRFLFMSGEPTSGL